MKTTSHPAHCATAIVNRFRLKPRGDKWELSQNGSPVGFFATKEQALSWSIEIVNEVTGSLAIHRADGTIEEERIYPRAADPAK